MLGKRPLLVGKPTCTKQESFWHLQGHQAWPPLEWLPLSKTRDLGVELDFLGKEELSLQTALPSVHREQVGCRVEEKGSLCDMAVAQEGIKWVPEE